jgi:hypothetical protein
MPNNEAIEPGDMPDAKLAASTTPSAVNVGASEVTMVIVAAAVLEFPNAFVAFKATR